MNTLKASVASVTLVVLLALAAACNLVPATGNSPSDVAPSAPTPSPSSTPSAPSTQVLPDSDWSLSLVRVWTDEEVGSPPNSVFGLGGPVKDAWKRVVVELALTNTTDEWGIFAPRDVNTGGSSDPPVAHGMLLDSGGYERRVEFLPAAYGLLGEPFVVIPPRFTIQMLAKCEIPDIYSPEALRVSMPGNREDTRIDLLGTNSITTIDVGDLGSVPAEYPMQVGDSYEFNNGLVVTVTSLEISKSRSEVVGTEGSVIAVATLSLTNNGGYDMTFEAEDVELIIIDNYGHYSRGDRQSSIDKGILNGKILPPGRTAVGVKESAPIRVPISDVETLWVILAIGTDDANSLAGIFRIDTSRPSATLTPTPSPTLSPNTAPGSILEPGEIWFQDGMAVQLRNPTFAPGCNGVLGFELTIANYTSDEIVTDISGLDFVLADNTGQSYSDIWLNDAPATQSCYPGRLRMMEIHTMAPGQRIDLALRAIGQPAEGTTQYTLTIYEAGRVQNAVWAIDAPH